MARAVDRPNMASEDADELSTYTLTGTRLSPKRMRVDTGDAEFVVGKDVSPVEYFLGSLLACLNSTGTMVAMDMDLEIESLTATVEGDIDYGKYRGDRTDGPAGFQDVRLTLDVESDADGARLEEWAEAVERRCPISENVQGETAVSVSVLTE